MRKVLAVISFLLLGPVYAIDTIDKQPFLIRSLPGPRAPVHTITQPTDGIPIRLDDSSTGQLTVKQLSKVVKGVNPGEDYQLSVKNSEGIVLGQTNVVACYENFQLALLDLLGGPGDELVFISQEYHGSPTFSPILTIYNLDTRGLVAIGSTQVGSLVIGCGLYADQAELDLTHKPVRFIFGRQGEAFNTDFSQCSEFSIKRRCFLWSMMKNRYEEVARCAK